MNYTRAKVFNVIFFSAFMLVGAFTFLAFATADELVLVPLVVGAMFFFGGGAIMRAKLRELSTFQKKTYAWYKSTYPDHVGSGGVKCASCGSTRTNVRALMQHRYHREHFCTDCGKTLYYSPEQSD